MSRAPDTGEVLNLIGLSTGVVLYAMLFAMVVRAHRGSARTPFDPLLVPTASLGLVKAFEINAVDYLLKPNRFSWNAFRSASETKS